MSTASTAPAGKQLPALSEAQRITKIFYEPSQTFADLRRSAAFWGPVLVMAVFSLAMVYTAGRMIGWEQLNENQMRMAPAFVQEQMEKMPPEQRAAAIANSVTQTQVIAYLFTIIAVIMLVIIAAVLMGTFNFALGAEVSFKHSLAVVFYASLPGAVLKPLLVIVSLLAGADPEAFIFQNPVGSNIGYFLNPADSPFLFSLLTYVDVFLIWTLVLTAIGFSVLSKVKTGTAAVVVFGWWAFFALLTSAPALLMSR